MASQKQIILVTGASRGIGQAIVAVAAQRFPHNTYLLGVRSNSSGVEAVAALPADDMKAQLDVLELDVTSDKSIDAAVSMVKAKYGRLDALINNAGIASIPASSSVADLRSTFDATLATNVASVAAVTRAFLPLLHASPAPKVINISSGRASLTRSTTGALPPTRVMAYSVSKTALNALTIEMQKSEDVAEGKIRFWAANPGHCKTAFNGFQGKKDPRDGAEVVVHLLGDEAGEYGKGGFWEFEHDAMAEVPW